MKLNFCLMTYKIVYYSPQVNQPLDYERIKEYNLTIRVEVSTVYFVVNLADSNQNI